jgi:hypothetical protein
VFHFNLKSDFAYGHVVVGVRSTLPVKDMSSLFGIDVAGDKVIMDPIISEEASYAENELENRGFFSCVCCNFNNEKNSLVEEDTLLQGGIIEASDVELKDTFVY